MSILVLVRHGQSSWNLENRFTGEEDVPLTTLGQEEARSAGRKLRNTIFTRGFTSVLKRAIDTMNLIKETAGFPDLPVTNSRELNERNYGRLQGLNKVEVAKRYGDEQVAIWRRSFSIKPPGGESLADTAARVLPYYHKNIGPLLKQGQNILVVAHGNSLRALLMSLENISEDNISHFDLPTGAPRRYEFDDKGQVKKVDYL